jgi:hypothetical protein
MDLSLFLKLTLTNTNQMVISKFKIRALSPVCSLILSGTHVHSNIDIQIIAIESTGQYLQSNQSTLADGSLLRLGTFDDVALGNLTAGQLADFSTVDGLFTEYATFTSSGGNITGVQNIPFPGTSGDALYTWVFDSNDTGTANEYGIFNSSSWLSPPDGGTANLVSISIDNIVFGSSAGSGPADYLLAAVPEPATYAAIFGVLGLALVMWRRRR